MESAIPSRLTTEVYMPSLPIVSPPHLPTVLGGRLFRICGEVPRGGGGWGRRRGRRINSSTSPPRGEVGSSPFRGKYPPQAGDGPAPGGETQVPKRHSSESIANRYDPSGRNAADPLQPLVARRDRRRDAALRLPFQSGAGPHHATRDPRPADDRA